MPDDIQQIKDLVSQILARVSFLETENEALKAEILELKQENQEVAAAVGFE